MRSPTHGLKLLLKGICISENPSFVLFPSPSTISQKKLCSQVTYTSNSPKSGSHTPFPPNQTSIVPSEDIWSYRFSSSILNFNSESLKNPKLPILNASLFIDIKVLLLQQFDSLCTPRQRNIAFHHFPKLKTSFYCHLNQTETNRVLASRLDTSLC